MFGTRYAPRRRVIAVLALAGALGCAATGGVSAPGREIPPPPSARATDIWQQIAPLFVPPAQLAGDLGELRPVLRFDDGREVRTAADWARRRTELLARWHGLLGPWPPLVERPRWKETSREIAPEGFARSKIDLEIAPGKMAASVYLLVPPGKGPFPAVVDVFYYPEDCAGLRPAKRLQNDFGYQMVVRGFVALCIGQDPTAPRPGADLYHPVWDRAALQPLSYLAYVAASGHGFLAARSDVRASRIGVVGHSYGGKWALFAGAFWEKFAAVCISDPGIVFDESRSAVNYWEPWYLGYVAGTSFRPRGVLTNEHPRVGPYRTMVERGLDLHELHALIAPRPFFVSGGSEDPPFRWKALNHTIAVNKVLGAPDRVGMASRETHAITPGASAEIALFFEYFLKEAR